MDLVYLLGAALLLWVTVTLVAVFERLGEAQVNPLYLAGGLLALGLLVYLVLALFFPERHS